MYWLALAAIFQTPAITRQDVEHPFGLTFGQSALSDVQARLKGKKLGGDEVDPSIFKCQSAPGIMLDGRVDDGKRLSYLGLDAWYRNNWIDDDPAWPNPRPAFHTLNLGDPISLVLKKLRALGNPSGMWSGGAYWTLTGTEPSTQPLRFVVDFAGGKLQGLRWFSGWNYPENAINRTDVGPYRLSDVHGYDSVFLVQPKRSYGEVQPINYIGVLSDAFVESARPWFVSKPMSEMPAIWVDTREGYDEHHPRGQIEIVGPRMDGSWGELLSALKARLDEPVEVVDYLNDSRPAILIRDGDIWPLDPKTAKTQIFVWSYAKQHYVMLEEVAQSRRFSNSVRAKVSTFYKADDLRFRKGLPQTQYRSLLLSMRRPFGLQIWKTPLSLIARRFGKSSGHRDQEAEWNLRGGGSLQAEGSSFGTKSPPELMSLSVAGWKGELGSAGSRLGKAPALIAPLKIGESRTSVLDRLRVLGIPRWAYEDSIHWDLGSDIFPNNPYPIHTVLSVTFDQGRLQSLSWENG